MNNQVVILHNKVFDHSNPDEADVLEQVNLVAEAYRQLGYKTVSTELGTNPFEGILEVQKINPSTWGNRFLKKGNCYILVRPY
jgi:hypothetical protein